MITNPYDSPSEQAAHVPFKRAVYPWMRWGVIAGVPLTLLCMLPYTLAIVMPAVNAARLYGWSLDWASVLQTVLLGLGVFVIGVVFVTAVFSVFGAVLALFHRHQRS